MENRAPRRWIAATTSALKNADYAEVLVMPMSTPDLSRWRRFEPAEIGITRVL
jgi:hypothetical protein